MDNVHFYIALGVPFFTVALMYIVGAISNRSAVNDLRSEMRAGFSDMNARFTDMGARFSDLSARMDRIEKRLDTIDTEIRINHDHRLAVLEARVLGRAS